MKKKKNKWENVSGCENDENWNAKEMVEDETVNKMIFLSLLCCSPKKKNKETSGRERERENGW